MSGIRTAETRNMVENAEEVPEKVVCLASEQQNEKIQRNLKGACRRSVSFKT